MGFRTVEVSGTRILLNGKPIFLRGISIHAEAPYRGGRVDNDQDVATLLGWAHELGCNYVRLAHYPHDQRMTRATDRLGIMVWSEIPVYWAEHFGDPAVLKKAEQQLSEEIRRDRDKASILLWSIANETPNTPERTKFLKTLAGDVRALDSSRLVTAALLVRTEGHSTFCKRLIRKKALERQNKGENQAGQIFTAERHGIEAGEVDGRLGRSCFGASTSRYMAAAELSSSMPAGSARILACAAMTAFHSYLLTITEE
jgi:hypothetical protein